VRYIIAAEFVAHAVKPLCVAVIIVITYGLTLSLPRFKQVTVPQNQAAFIDTLLNQWWRDTILNDFFALLIMIFIQCK
jgi:hypothetical protein